jgi:hypothetical protein
MHSVGSNNGSHITEFIYRPLQYSVQFHWRMQEQAAIREPDDRHARANLCPDDWQPKRPVNNPQILSQAADYALHGSTTAREIGTPLFRQVSEVTIKFLLWCQGGIVLR